MGALNLHEELPEVSAPTAVPPDPTQYAPDFTDLNRNLLKTWAVKPKFDAFEACTMVLHGCLGVRA